jgi:hypothetical protein
MAKRAHISTFAVLEKGPAQNETDTSKARRDIGRCVEREQLRGKAQISGQLSDPRRVSAGKNRNGASHPMHDSLEFQMHQELHITAYRGQGLSESRCSGAI